MEITVNGKAMSIGQGSTVSSLLEELNIDLKTVVVEVNLQIPDRDRMGNLPLREGDVVEVIRLVSGG